jgi:hypothetical protein
MTTCPFCGKPASPIEGAEGGVYSCGPAGCGNAFFPDEVDQGAAPSGIAPMPEMLPRESETPARSATREEWNAFAATLGIDGASMQNKDEVIAAVEAAAVA